MANFLTTRFLKQNISKMDQDLIELKKFHGIIF